MADVETHTFDDNGRIPNPPLPRWR